MTVVMFQALEGASVGIVTAAASTVIVVTLIPVALLYRLVRRYELGSQGLSDRVGGSNRNTSP